jgi:hypothetical protein
MSFLREGGYRDGKANEQDSFPHGILASRDHRGSNYREA